VFAVPASQPRTRVFCQKSFIYGQLSFFEPAQLSVSLIIYVETQSHGAEKRAA
jgi:hypothetical protein